MARNSKALTDEELKFVNDNYVFDVLNGEYIMVTYADYDRKILHEINKPFSLNIRKINRKVTISLQAIELWLNKYRDKHSLIDVQNAISSLIVTYQDLSEEEIEQRLSKPSNKIKIK